jgi:rhamnose utilization protein RhaD (predicted bifunctional aldolase and dehydrogenase)
LAEKTALQRRHCDKVSWLFYREERILMEFDALIRMSRKYGPDPEYVLAGGGNTSCKAGGLMAVKASGCMLSTIGEEGFVLMDIEKLRALTQAKYPEGDKEREACALKDMMSACIVGQGDKRPSVECILHALFDKPYVLHVHPPLINGLTCGRKSMEALDEIFDDMQASLLWVPLTKPGYTLSRVCADMIEGHIKSHGRPPSVLLLQNHGIFIAAETAPEVDGIMAGVVSRISKKIVRKPDLATGESTDKDKDEKKDDVPAKGAAEAVNMLGELYGGVALDLYNNEIARLTESRESYSPVCKPFTPDHIVYCRAYPLFVDEINDLKSSFKEYGATHGGKPKIVAIRGIGVFALGKDGPEAGRAADLYLDAVKIAVYSESFGGPLALPDDFTDFIVNWVSESYRHQKI